MFFDLALRLGNLLIELLDLVLFGELFTDEGLLLVLFFFLHLLVTRNVLMQVHLIILELLLRIDERLVATLLPLLELFDLLLHRIVGKLSKEHFLFLVDEFCGILGALLFGELDASLGDHHGPVDVLLLLLGVSRFFVLRLLVFLRWGDIAVLDAM